MTKKATPTKEAALKIGNSSLEHLGESMAEFSKAIQDIFKAGNVNRMEQETIRTAINAFAEIAKIEGVVVSGSVFQGDKTVNVDLGDEEEDE